jgi:hypothetical protein
MALKKSAASTKPSAASLRRPSAPSTGKTSPPAQEQQAPPPIPASQQSSSTDLILVVPKEMAEVFADDAQENMANVHDAFHRISIEGSRYKVAGNLIGDKGVEFTGIILKETPVNMFYKTRYEKAKPVNPDCWSLGGLVPDSAVAEKQNADCPSCPQNRFGTGTDEKGQKTKGKACRNARRLVLMIDGVDMPVIMSLPPTTIKPFNAYLKMLSSNQPPVPMFAVHTLFTFDEKSQFPRPLCSAKGVVSSQEYADIREYRQTQVVLDALNAYASPADAVEETEEQAQDTMEHGEHSKMF